MSGYRAFSAVAGTNGDTFYYAIHGGTEWEVGLGTRASSSTFTRTTVFASSNSGSAVSLSAGTKEVWMDMPARLLQVDTPSINPNFINGSIVESHTGNAVTYAVKTLAGANASQADPVFFVFAATDGTTYVRTVTAALSITIASGATMGAPSAKGFRIWLAAMDNAGTVELAVRNCCDQTTGNIAAFPAGGENRISTTVQAGAGDDLALVTYSATARSNLPYIALCNFSYTSLTTAGTWDASPATINLFSRQMPRPGEVIQSLRVTTNTPTTGGAASSYVDTPLSQAITLSSVAHAVRVTAYGGSVKTTAGGVSGLLRLRNTTQSTIVGAGAFQVYVNSRPNDSADDHYAPMGMMGGVDFPSSVSAQTYKVQIADGGIFGSVTYPNAFGTAPTATMVVEELMT